VPAATLQLSENRLASRLATRLAERAQASNLALSGQIVAWMDLVDLCRELDESFVIDPSPSNDTLAMHEQIVQLAINVGDSLLDQVANSSEDIKSSGQTAETLTASLELLRIFHRSRHPQISPEEVQAVRQRIFNAAA
jgi:hypothetical protein